MSDENKDNSVSKMKIVFMEGCFDDFDGTQEELDEIIAQLNAMVDSGELLENSVEIGSLDDIDEEVLDILPLLSSNTRH